MIILGIDPSFTRTGIAVLNKESITTSTVSVTDKSVYEIDKTLMMSRKLSRLIFDKVIEHNPKIIIIEYPILATRSGSYLGLIQQAVYDRLKNLKYQGTLILVPAQAINSITKNKTKTKTHIINWVKDNTTLTTKINHDEASAVVLTKLAQLIEQKEYKNSYHIIEFK